MGEAGHNGGRGLGGAKYDGYYAEGNDDQEWWEGQDYEGYDSGGGYYAPLQDKEKGPGGPRSKDPRKERGPQPSPKR